MRWSQMLLAWNFLHLYDFLPFSIFLMRRSSLMYVSCAMDLWEIILLLVWYSRFHGVPAEERLHWRSFLVKLGTDNLKGAKNEELFVASHKYAVRQLKTSGETYGHLTTKDRSVYHFIIGICALRYFTWKWWIRWIITFWQIGTFLHVNSVSSIWVFVLYDSLLYFACLFCFI